MRSTSYRAHHFRCGLVVKEEEVLTFYGGRSSVGRALDCDSSGRGFEPHRPPHLTGPLAQLVEQWTLNPLVEGSNPSRPTK